MLFRIVPVLLACVVVAGCGSSPKTRFYVLQAPPLPAAPSAVADPSQPGVAVGPVTLPEAVERTQFVVRTGENTLDISDANRWAEPLKSAITRVLVANLAQQLGTTRVSPFGAGTASDQDFRVAVDILSFEAALGKTAAIEAQWTITRPSGGKPSSGRSAVRQELEGGDYEAAAAGYGCALAQLSREIAAAIREMRGK